MRQCSACSVAPAFIAAIAGSGSGGTSDGKRTLNASRRIVSEPSNTPFWHVSSTTSYVPGPSVPDGWVIASTSSMNALPSIALWIVFGVPETSDRPLPVDTVPLGTTYTSDAV